MHFYLLCFFFFSVSPHLLRASRLSRNGKHMILFLFFFLLCRSLLSRWYCDPASLLLLIFLLLSVQYTSFYLKTSCFSLLLRWRSETAERRKQARRRSCMASKARLMTEKARQLRSFFFFSAVAVTIELYSGDSHQHTYTRTHTLRQKRCDAFVDVFPVRMCVLFC